MYKHLHLELALLMALAAPISAETLQRRATLTGMGNSDRGKCTVEVVVDGAAEIQIRGDTATMRNLSGQTPQWRRFQCTGPMPANPGNFRFQGVDGRGSQELVRDPRNGGGAVVRITDTPGGAEGYTFDLIWGGGGNEYGRPGDDRGYYSDRPPSYGRFSGTDTVRVCEESVRQQAVQRFHTSNITFRRSNMNDNPGPQDWVTGVFDVRSGPYGRDESYSYSCAVNFDTGEVRSMRIEPIGGGARQDSPRGMENCERAVEERIRRDGYDFVDFGSLRVDDRRGRGDWIVGTVTANRGRRPESFEFTCSVNLQSGNVRSVDVTRR